MRILTETDATLDDLVADHVALPSHRPSARGLVRVNMVSSADGGSAVEGVSGGLGDSADHVVFAALRAHADVVLVGLSTAVAEHYHPPSVPGQQMLVVASTPDISGNPELFASGDVTLVLPDDAGPAPDGVPTRRAGTGRHVDLGAVVAQFTGKVVMMEGGPTLAGLMVADGLVDEFFLTVAPRLVAGDSARVVHGPAADPEPWKMLHAFEDEFGFFFMRYGRANVS
jgi:riboflavin biosynthesis pyrimidine reductase